MTRRYDESGEPVYCSGSGGPVPRGFSRYICPECGRRAHVTRANTLVNLRKCLALTVSEIATGGRRVHSLDQLIHHAVEGVTVPPSRAAPAISGRSCVFLGELLTPGVGAP